MNDDTTYLVTSFINGAVNTVESFDNEYDAVALKDAEEEAQAEALDAGDRDAHLAAGAGFRMTVVAYTNGIARKIA